jgi:type II secretion system protein J
MKCGAPESRASVLECGRPLPLFHHTTGSAKRWRTTALQNLAEFRAPQSNRRSGRAFTLIEILVAIAIFSLVIMAIYATWTLIIKSAKIGQDAAIQIQRERIAMRTLKEALASVMSFQADQQNYAFVAENDGSGFLSFAARLPEMFPRSSRLAFDGFDVRRVSFAVEQGKDYQRQLVLRQTPLLKEMNSDEQDFPFVVATGVNKMEMEFYDLRKRDWVSEWTRTNELPRMVKMKLEFERKNPKEPYAAGVKEEVIEILPLPSVMVPSIAQGGRQTGREQIQQTPPPITNP